MGEAAPSSRRGWSGRCHQRPVEVIGSGITSTTAPGRHRRRHPRARSASPSAAASAGEHVRTLATGQGRATSRRSSMPADPHPQECPPPGDVSTRLGRARPGRWSRPIEVVMAGHTRSTGRTNSSNVTKLLTGLPGRPNSSTPAVPAPGSPEGQRLARLDGDTPEVDLADLLERVLDHVMGADRDPAADHDRRPPRRDPLEPLDDVRRSSRAMPSDATSPPASASLGARAPPSCCRGSGPRQRAPAARARRPSPGSRPAALGRPSSLSWPPAAATASVAGPSSVPIDSSG